jgi:RNA polymerase sigma-70 factor, ECF subfamily
MCCLTFGLSGSARKGKKPVVLIAKRCANLLDSRMKYAKEVHAMKKTNRKNVMQARAIVGRVAFVGSRQIDFSGRNPQPANFVSATAVCNIPKKPLTFARPIESKSLSENEIIRRAQDGDEPMFEYLYRLHNRRVYAVCLRLLKDPTEAEDLTQEAFLLLVRKISTFRGESAFSTWLHRLAVNRVLMHLRKKSLQVVSIEVAPDPHDETGSPSIDIGMPDLLMEGTLDRINLERCIAQLPLGYRTIFVLHDIQGHEHREIAAILGRSIGASKSQLYKARRRLRELLHEIERGKAGDARVAAA